jgi:hypothetical protein
MNTLAFEITPSPSSDDTEANASGCPCAVMPIRYKAALALILSLIAGFVAWHLIPKGSPVTVAFVRYQKAGSDWLAYMEVRNNTSRPVSYHSAGFTSTEYVWESPQIDWALRLGSPLLTLPPRTNVPFRVLVMTTDADWRVGIDYVLGSPSWMTRLPPWLQVRAQRVAMFRESQQRAWSPRITRPTLDERLNENR